MRWVNLLLFHNILSHHISTSSRRLSVCIVMYYILFWYILLYDKQVTEWQSDWPRKRTVDRITAYIINPILPKFAYYPTTINALVHHTATVKTLRQTSDKRTNKATRPRLEVHCVSSAAADDLSIRSTLSPPVALQLYKTKDSCLSRVIFTA